MVIKREGFEGWRVFWAATLALAAMALGLLVAAGWDVEGYRLVIRVTARTSLIFFLAAFAASAAAKLWPNGFTRWLRRNRRQLGLSFAMSHFIHALAIYAFYSVDPDTFWSLQNAGALATGGIAYVFIALLAATSFDRMVRAMGPKSWSWLHWAGVWFIAISFIFTNGKRIPVSGYYAIPVAMVLIAIALRIIAARQKKAAMA